MERVAIAIYSNVNGLFDTIGSSDSFGIALPSYVDCQGQNLDGHLDGFTLAQPEGQERPIVLIDYG